MIVGEGGGSTPENELSFRAKVEGERGADGVGPYLEAEDSLMGLAYKFCGDVEGEVLTLISSLAEEI